MCVWAKRYPSFNEVPDIVTYVLLHFIYIIINQLNGFYLISFLCELIFRKEIGSDNLLRTL